MNIRKVNLTDKQEWARMRNALWPSSTNEHLDDIEKYLSKGEIDIVEVFVVERSNGKQGGFIEQRRVVILRRYETQMSPLSGCCNDGRESDRLFN